MTTEQLDHYHIDKAIQEKKYKIEGAEQRKKYKKECKYVDQIKIKNGIQYIESLPKMILDQSKKVYIDPGNNTLLEMIDDVFETSMNKTDKSKHHYSYKKKYRKHECRMDIRAITSHKRMTTNESLKNYQQQISTTRRKSSCTTTFNEYLDIYFNLQADDYLNLWWRYQQLRTYGFTKQHEEQLLNKISSLFGKDAVYIIGDHSVGSMRGTRSSKGVGLKRLLQTRFPHVYHIDEYNTSKLYWKTHKEGEQWYSSEARSYKSPVAKKKGRRGRGLEMKRYKNRQVEKEENEASIKGRSIHALKKFQSLNKLSVCINRDLNATLNMRYITRYMVENNNIRPKEYCRTHHLEGPEKEITPSKLCSAE